MPETASLTRGMLRTAVMAGAALLLCGCMTARLEESRNNATAIAADEAVVLLAKPHVEGITAEDDFMDCVGKKMAGNSRIQVRSNNEFVDSMFPWLEPSTAPQRPEGVTQLLAREAAPASAPSAAASAASQVVAVAVAVAVAGAGAGAGAGAVGSASIARPAAELGLERSLSVASASAGCLKSSRSEGRSTFHGVRVRVGERG